MDPGLTLLPVIREDQSDRGCIEAVLPLPPSTTGSSAVPEQSVIMSNVASVASSSSSVSPSAKQEKKKRQRQLVRRRILALVAGVFMLVAASISAVVIVAQNHSSSPPPLLRAAGTSAVDDNDDSNAAPVDGAVDSNNSTTSSDTEDTSKPTSQPTVEPHKNDPVVDDQSPSLETLYPTTAEAVDPDIVQALDVVLTDDNYYYYSTSLLVPGPVLLSKDEYPHNNSDTSIPYQARHWMLHEDYLRDDILHYGPERVRQRFAMVVLFFSLGLHSQVYADQDEWDWSGGNIQANMDGQVHYIDLENQGLVGSLPRQIGALQSLQVLNLGNNALSGTIPESLGKYCKHLFRIDLSVNQLGGSIPASLWELQSLRFLFLDQNQLTGTLGVPEAASSSLLLYPSMLQDVRLYHNQLTGSMPWWFGQRLTQLERWLAWDNALSGDLPLELPVSLKILDLQFNDFSGPLPDQIWKNMANLHTLYLDHNKLTGTLPEWKDMKSLSTVALNNNDLQGEIPSNYGSKWNVTDLYLDGNPQLTASNGFGPFAEEECRQVWPFLQCLRADVQSCACCRTDCGFR